jgi:flagellar hook assembly protein FlgD
VKTVCDAVADAGWNQAEWDGTNNSGGRVASGVYFLRVSACGDSRTEKVVLIR